MKKIVKRVFFVFKLHRSIPFLVQFLASKKVSFKKKALYVSLIALYFALPFDLIFDYIPVAGIIDDFTIFAFLLDRMRKSAPIELQTKYK